MATTATMGTFDPAPTRTRAHDLEGLARASVDIPLFRSLPRAERERLLARGWTQQVERGQVLYCEGEIVHNLHLVLEGSVKLVRNSEEGKELIVGLAGEGDAFGPLVRPAPAAELAQALEPSRIHCVPVAAVRRAPAATPAFAFDLLELAESRRAAANATAARLAFETVPQRLGRLLLGLVNRYGTLRFPLNQTEIANLIGSSRETVCSVLNRLRREGVVSITKGRLRILDRDRLATVR